MLDSDDNDLLLTQSTFRTNDEDDEQKDDEDEFAFRFGQPLTEKELEGKFTSNIAKRTQMKNDWALRILTRWQEERRQRSVSENLNFSRRCLTQKLTEMTANELNTVLKYFVFETRKKDGKHYPSSTLYGLFAAFASVLKESGTNFKLFEDDDFKEARKALDAAMREKSAMGLGTSSRKPTEVISFQEEDQLWRNGVLGDDIPQKLLDTVVYLTGLQFALRGGNEHRSLRMYQNPQITGPFVDPNGRRYLRYVEDTSKTNPGGMKNRKMKSKEVRAYENKDNPARCYVRLFEKYKSLCPKCIGGNGRDAFYLTPLKVPKPKQWFHDMPVGHNTLQETVKRICKSAGVTGIKTNHSLRATAATRLYQNNVDEQTICEHTGHRSEAVRIYKRCSDQQKAEVSDILSGSRQKIESSPPCKTRSRSSTVTTEEGAGSVSFTFNFN